LCDFDGLLLITLQLRNW